MPQSNNSRASQRTRPIAAAISSIAIGLAGVGATALPASGDPDGGGDAPVAPVAAAPVAEHSVTLITGDRVQVTDLSDGTHTVEIDTAQPGAGVETFEIDGDLHVFPAAAMPYLAAKVLDADLFNVSQLIEYGYDDASVDATPIIVELDPGARRAFGAGVPGVEVGAGLPSIGGAAAAADHDAAADTWTALTGTAPAAGARAFRAEGEVAFGGGIAAIHLDGKVRATLDSSVPYAGAPTAWEAGYTGEGVTVAVLDTGYDDTHPDLQGRVLPDSKSFVPGEEVDTDSHGHGTHVASTVAGTGAASGGTHRGVADGADLLIGKVLDADGYGQDSWVIAAMQWAGERADIVSMSLGSDIPSDGEDVMSQALNSIAEQTGALFVVAAGNATHPETIGGPGAAVEALTVGSVDDPSGALSWFSSQGPLAGSGALKPEIAAPGSDVTAARSADRTSETGSYLVMSGTSMATPHVAGAAAIVKQQHPEYTADQLRAALLSSANDVGLSAYQVGSGALDVAAATTAPVLAEGSGDFGTLAWGEAAEPVTRTVEYTNRTTAEVVIALEASLTDTSPGSGGIIPGRLGAATSPDAVLTLDVDELVIPAGETRAVTLTADPAQVAAGAQLSGTLTASLAGEAVARTALGIIAEAERYDLTVTATGFDGEPVDTYGYLWNAETGSIELFVVSGEVTLRRPAGTYSVMTFMDVDRAADERTIVLLGDPDLVLDGAADVAFDAREAEKVSVDVGERGLEATVRRMDFKVDGFTGSALANVLVDDLYAQPMTAPHAQEFDYTMRWRLQQPTLELTAGRERLDLIPQAGSPLYDGSVRARAVDAGTGTVAEFASIDAKGKVAVVTRSAEISAYDQAANAHAAGAVLVILVNDADGELSEWVGSPDYESEVSIPVAAVSGVQGRQLLAAMAKGSITVKGAGVAVADEIWDIAQYSDGAIPAELDYRPGKLARIDTTYHGDAGETVGEYRYDFVPSTQYGIGYPMRTERGLERIEWVNTDQVRWYQDATVVDVQWNVRDVVRSYAAGSRSEASYFGAVVRPYIGPGYWAPNLQGDAMQLNLPGWADGDSPDRTGALDTYSGRPEFAQHTELFIDDAPAVTSDYQSVAAWDIGAGAHEVRVVTTATHDGTIMPTSTSTRTEWSFTATASTTDYSRVLLPMLQAYYDVDLDDQGRAGDGRRKGAPVTVGLEIGHIAGATGSAAVSAATLEARTAGGDWQPVPLTVTGTDNSGPGEVPGDGFTAGRAFLTIYGAAIPVADAGGWVDLRVTATDAAGGTLSQEIVKAFQVAPAKGAGKPGKPGRG